MRSGVGRRFDVKELTARALFRFLASAVASAIDPEGPQ
jgi:hypothetical protein